MGAALPDSVDVEFANGCRATIEVKYPWKPVMCLECHVFGHATLHCPRQNTTQSKGHEWVVKAGAKPVAAVELIDTPIDLKLGAETLVEGSSLPGVENDPLVGGLDPRSKVVDSSGSPGTSKMSPVPSGANVVHSPLLAQSNSFSALALVEDKEEVAQDLDDGKET